MIEEYLARSAGKHQKEQSYAEHISGTIQNGQEVVRGLEPYVGEIIYGSLIRTVLNSTEGHDLGKLDPNNQKVLHKSNGGVLPIAHEDAGAAYLKKKDRNAAVLVYSHHRGLPDLSKHLHHMDVGLRNLKLKDYTDQMLPFYLKLHNDLLSDSILQMEQSANLDKWDPLLYRIALSCLTDADYSDAGGQAIEHPAPLWEKRLARMTDYVSALYDSSEKNDRNCARMEFYQYCKKRKTDDPITYCSGTVGSGKTTALMAYLLKCAAENNLRHIIVVAPYNSIITQTVKIYRKALILEEEKGKEESIVAELDCNADYSDSMARNMAQIWRAPIIVTSAVQFFETLASNKPSVLRKFHELPGSAVLIDESHVCLPCDKLQLGWYWLTELAEKYGCFFTLASGTTVKFWEHKWILKQGTDVIPVLNSEMEQKLKKLEKQRAGISLPSGQKKDDLHFESFHELFQFSEHLPYPQIFVFNQIETAVRAAGYLKSMNIEVYHLSTVFKNSDRAKLIETVEKRLKDKTNVKWAVTATKCIESGMNFSFRTGFCEMCSVRGFYQLLGRISRESEYPDGWLYGFTLDRGVNDTSIPEEFKDSIAVFQLMLGKPEKYIFTPENASDLSSKAFELEMRRKPKEKAGDQTLLKSEQIWDFDEIAQKYKVIEDYKATVVVNSEIVAQMERGERIPSHVLYQNSVEISKKLLEEKLQLDPVGGYDQIYKLDPAQYDPELLGYFKTLMSIP